VSADLPQARRPSPDAQLHRERFLNTAQGSLKESRYCLILSEDLGCNRTGELMNSPEEVSKLLNAY
jgi:four helix bundle protein